MNLMGSTCDRRASGLRHLRLSTTKLAVVALLALLIQSCFGGVDCDCVASGFDLNIPSTATALRLSGDACEGAKVTCNQRTPASGDNLCSDNEVFHHVDPGGPGTCKIVVEFEGREAFMSELEIHRGGGCCGGLHPESDSVIEVK